MMAPTIMTLPADAPLVVGPLSAGMAKSPSAKSATTLIPTILMPALSAKMLYAETVLFLVLEDQKNATVIFNYLKALHRH